MFNSPGKQSVVRILISVAGYIIGALSTLFIYPLDMKLHGLSTFLLTASLMFAPFILVGSGAVAINNYNEFKTEDKRDNGFLGVIISMYLLGSLIFALLFFVGGDWLSHFFESRDADYNKYFMYILPLTILQAGCALIDVYLNNFTKVIIPALFKEFLLKLTLPLLIGLHILGYISIEHVVWGLVGNYVLALVLLLIYTAYLRKESFVINFSFLTGDRVKRIMYYAFFAILSAFGNQLVLYIDTVMIKAILPDFKYVSIYNMHSSISNFINIPVIAIISVASPIVARYLSENDMGKLAGLYRSTSSIMLLLGTFLLMGILINMESVYAFMSNGDAYSLGFMIIVFLGLTKIVDMGTGLNGQIIGYSQYYRINFYTLIVLGLSNAILNYFLIHTMGVTGAALATLISMVLYNLFKLYYVRKKFGIWPFSNKDILIIMFAILSALAAYMAPNTGNPFIQILIRTTLFTVLFWAAALYFNLSPRVTIIIKDNWKKFRKGLGK